VPETAADENSQNEEGIEKDIEERRGGGGGGGKGEGDDEGEGEEGEEVGEEYRDEESAADDSDQDIDSAGDLDLNTAEQMDRLRAELYF
jgi:hypothetical protein